MGALATLNALEIHKKSLPFPLSLPFPVLPFTFANALQTLIKPLKMRVFALRKLR